MNTVSTSPQNFSRKTSSEKSFSMSNIWAIAEYNRFGIISMLIAVMAILGGLAGAVALQDGYVKLIAVALATSFVESMILAVASMRIITIASVLALIVDVLVLAL